MAVIDIFNSKRRKGSKGYLVLVDPDKRGVDIKRIVDNVNRTAVDVLLVGGSRCDKKGFNSFIKNLRRMTDAPIVLFPGSHDQLSRDADAILLLSLINSRSLKHVIGEHIDGAERIAKSGIEVIPTAYIVMDKTGKTSVSKAAKILSPKTNSEARKYLYASSIMSYSLLYLEAGSGAERTIDSSLVKTARRITDKPIIVGGGIRDRERAKSLLLSGADFIVTGNAIEKNPDLILELGSMINEF